MRCSCRRFRPLACTRRRVVSAVCRRSGFTLIEVLIATALTLLLMAAAVTAFGVMSSTVVDSRALMEMTDRLRSTQHRLQTDLRFATVRAMIPPLDPRDNLGYMEIVEGPGPAFNGTYTSGPYTGLPQRLYGEKPITDTNAPDTTVGDVDDFVMFTARSYKEPFIGRMQVKAVPNNSETPAGSDGIGNYAYHESTIKSRDAEICWFLRGTTLYRRCLLVVSPDFDIRQPSNGVNPIDPLPAPGSSTYGNAFYNYYDISVHQEGGTVDPRRFASTPNRTYVPNTLGDLTKRENRYAHLPLARYTPSNVNWPQNWPYDWPNQWPHDVRHFGRYALPTLSESAQGNWPLDYGSSANSRPQGTGPSILPPQNPGIDYWSPQIRYQDLRLPSYSNNPTRRIGEDVVLTNVIGFDIKIWDNLAPVFIRTKNGGSPSVPILPGDPGYRLALRALGSAVSKGVGASGGDYTVIAQGAYVDLYYTRGLSQSTFGAISKLFRARRQAVGTRRTHVRLIRRHAARDL